MVQRDGSGNSSAGTITATLSRHASTATALVANGSNCSTGQAASGVNSSGAAEGCYDPNTYRSGQINFVYGGSPRVTTRRIFVAPHSVAAPKEGEPRIG